MVLFLNFIFVYLLYNLKANHNKDYSVVKTFKPPSSYNTGAFFLLYHATSMFSQYSLTLPKSGISYQFMYFSPPYGTKAGAAASGFQGSK
jgi:hypothetical protein